VATSPPRSRSRPKTPLGLQLKVFDRDGWICRWCHRPVVFSPTFRLVEEFVKRSGWSRPVAYFHPNWSRAHAPLLDHLGAVIDHVEAYASGGRHEEENFVTSCNKCNARKNSRRAADFQKQSPGRPVKGRYGEPKHWDGLVGLFAVLAGTISLNSGEAAWLTAIKTFYEEAAPDHSPFIEGD
jgi:5-methylcytosine-specific restriction endonuclease McrA